VNYFNPIKQNKFGNEGNCLSAVIATLFDVEMSSIPVFSDDGEYWVVELSKWMANRFGKYVSPIKLTHRDDVFIFCGSLMIATINSQNPDVDRHAVITKGDKIIFDPMVGEVDQPITDDMDITFMVIGDIRKNH